MIKFFKRLACAARGHGGVRFERLPKPGVPSVRGTRYTCKSCGSIWVEWDK